MKKSIPFIALALSVLLFASACSCQPTTKYSFTANWTDNGQYQEQIETLQYEITHKKESITFPSENGTTYGNLEAEETDVTYSNGTYLTVLETSPALPDGIADPRKEDASLHLYRLHTELNMTATFSTVGKTDDVKSNEDQIVSDVYFLDENKGLQPIYSKQEVCASAFSTAFNVYRYGTEAKYENGKVYLTVTAKDDVTKEAFRMTESAKSMEFDYTESAILDTEALLFAIRGMSLTDTFSSQYNLFSATAMETMAATVAVKESVPVSQNWTCTYNGETLPKGDTVQTWAISAIRANSTYTGFPKICYYQKKAESNQSKDNRCFLVRYINPLTNATGYLQYDLKSAVIEKR